MERVRIRRRAWERRYAQVCALLSARRTFHLYSLYLRNLSRDLGRASAGRAEDGPGALRGSPPASSQGSARGPYLHSLGHAGGDRRGTSRCLRFARSVVGDLVLDTFGLSGTQISWATSSPYHLNYFNGNRRLVSILRVDLVPARLSPPEGAWAKPNSPP